MAEQTGRVYLDAYDQALVGVLDLGRQIADTWQNDSVSLLVGAQADMLASLGTAYTAAARRALK